MKKNLKKGMNVYLKGFNYPFKFVNYIGSEQKIVNLQGKSNNSKMFDFEKIDLDKTFNENQESDTTNQFKIGAVVHLKYSQKKGVIYNIDEKNTIVLFESYYQTGYFKKIIREKIPVSGLEIFDENIEIGNENIEIGDVVHLKFGTQKGILHSFKNEDFAIILFESYSETGYFQNMMYETIPILGLKKYKVEKPINIW